MKQTYAMAGAAVLACGAHLCSGDVVAWYRFSEGTTGERVGSSVEIVNSANPGTLTGYCRQQNSNGGSTFASTTYISDVDTGYMPVATAGFVVDNGVIDPVTRDKLANGRAFAFTTSTWNVLNNNKYNVSGGSGGCVTVAQNAAFYLSSFTVECFFKMDLLALGEGQTDATSEQILVCLPNAAGGSSTPQGQYGFSLGVRRDKHQIWAQVRDSSNWQSGYVTYDSKDFVDGKWHHAAVTFDGNARTVVLYLDYSEVGRKTAVPTSLPHYDNTCEFPFTIGADPTYYGRRFTGAIDEVRISNAALSATDFLRPAAYVPEIDAPSTVCHVTFDTAATEEFGFPLWKELNAVPSSGAIPAEVKWDATKGVEPELVKDSLPVIEVYNARRKFNKTLTNAVALHAPTNQPFYSASLFIDDRKNGAHAVLDGSFTLEFFARVPAKPVGVKNSAAHLAFFGNASSGGPLNIAAYPDGNLIILLHDDDGNTKDEWKRVGQICDNQWHHIALTYDRTGKTAKAYLDWKPVNTWAHMNINFAVSDTYNSKMLEIGSGYGPDGSDGHSAGPWIDEFRLSNVALDPRDFLQGKQTRFTGMSVVVR